tara:strand:- start:531 stop:905 length:375 start_codon:yes stop_codon:yes gene_type:complete
MSDDSEKVDLERLCKLCIDNGFSTGHADTAIEFAGECVANLLGGKKKIEQLQAKIEKADALVNKLNEIKELGHTAYHGKGYTLATMIEHALTTYQEEETAWQCPWSLIPVDDPDARYATCRLGA